MSAGLVGNSQAQGNSGQGLSPAPFQNGVSENEQGFYSDIQPVSGNADSAAGNSSDRKNEVENVQRNSGTDRLSGNPVFYGLSGQSNEQEISAGVDQNDRTQEIKTLFQEPESGIQRGTLPADSFSGLDAGSDNRDTNFEVKNDSLDGSKNRLHAGGNLSGFPLDRVDNLRPIQLGGLVGFRVNESPSARLASPANQANFDAGNATKKQAKDAAQMPQSNATNATMQNIEFAQPSGWGKLWRLVQNGNYYYYELRFINADRVRQKGGKITPAIARKLAARKGKGRHEKSRKEAERFRCAAEHLAERIRAIS